MGMARVAVVSALRSPIGKAVKGSFKDVSIDVVLKQVVQSVISSVNPKIIEECVFGNVLSPDCNMVVTRAVLLSLGIPCTTPLLCVNRQCGSGLEAVSLIASKVRNGEIKCGLAGGYEDMSHNKIINDFIVSNELLTNDKVNGSMMSIGEIAELLCEKYSIGRTDADSIANRSQMRAKLATEKGIFLDEIVPIRVGERIIDKDDGIRDTSMEVLSRLRSSFREGGISTAGNSSQLSDGAAAALLMSYDKASELGLPIIGEIIDCVCTGNDPSLMGIGPVFSIKKLLERNCLTVNDIDLFEINEAFASQIYRCALELGIGEDKLNIAGGSIALGHPLGCTGARILCTLLNMMSKCNSRYGVASLCGRTGLSVSALVRRD